MISRRLAYCLFVVAVLVLGGCGEKQVPQYHATDITGVDFGRDFRLTDQTGKVRTLSDFRGKVVAIFFGYTHCPDVCPTTLSDFAMAMKLLGKEARKVQVIFVTVDPERDTRAVLAQYVPAFNPSFLGMYASPQDTATLAKSFRVFYQKQPADAHGGYTVDHSAGTYIYDPQGRLRLYMAYGQGPQAIAHDISLLLKN